MRALLVALLLVALTACGASKAPKPEQDRLPDVTLPGLAGDPAVDLGELDGPVVVNLWASYCVPCRKELPLYEAFAKEHDGRVDVLGVRYVDTNEKKSRQLLEATRVTFPNVRDEDGVFRAIALPKLLMVDDQGRVVYDEYVKIETLGQLEDLVEKHLGEKP